MTIALALARALEPILGPAEPTIHTAVPPRELGGDADVVEFRRAPTIRGAVLVAPSRTEVANTMMLCARAPESWAPRFLSQLAVAATQRRIVWNGTTPLGDPSAPFAGVAFVHAPTPISVRLSEEHGYATFLLAVGITRGELEVCRSHGTPHVMSLLRSAGVFPYSEPGRESVVEPSDVAPSALSAGPRLSREGQQALAAVVHGQFDEVEGLRGRFSASDGPILAAAYAQLGSFEQRWLLVHLLGDSRDRQLLPLWHTFAADALRERPQPQSGEHFALATALAAIDAAAGRRGMDKAYVDDLELAMAAARRLASA